MPENCTKLIDCLIKQRHNKGMTQKDLAELTNLKQSVIARFESKKHVPQLSTILEVAAALDCELKIIPSENELNA